MAAALLHSSAAHAGVVFQKPDTRKVFQGEKKPAPTKPAESSSGGGFSLPSFSAPSLPSFSLPGLPSAPSLPGVPTPQAPEVKLPGLELDAKTLALPGAIGAIAVAAFAASKIDSGFGEFMNESMVKDSTSFTGYEEDPPQARGSPEGFLGLGNLYPPALPGGKDTANKIKSASGQIKSKAGKGTLAIGKKAKQQGKSGGGGFKGLFGK